MNNWKNISSQKKVANPRSHTFSYVGWFKSKDQIPLLKTRTYPQNKEWEQVNSLIIILNTLLQHRMFFLQHRSYVIYWIYDPITIEGNYLLLDVRMQNRRTETNTNICKFVN